MVERAEGGWGEAFNSFPSNCVWGVCACRESKINLLPKWLSITFRSLRYLDGWKAHSTFEQHTRYCIEHTRYCVEHKIKCILYRRKW